MATKRESRKQAQAQAQENVVQPTIDTETGEILENDNMLSSQEEKETQPEMQLTDTSTESLETQEMTQETQEVQEPSTESQGVQEPSKEQLQALLESLLTDEKVTITPEMIEKLSGKNLSDALVKYASARKVTGKKDVPEFKFLPMPPNQVIHLSDLKTLLDTPIKNKEMAVREINEQNVDSLKAGYARGDAIPPISVVWSTIGPVIIYGRHRTKAMNDLIVDSHTDKNGNVNQQAVKDDKDNYPVPYKVVNELDPRKLVRMAFLENTTNGLPPSGDSRSRFAIYLLVDARENGEKLTQEQAADMVGVSRVAVVRMLARDRGTEGKGKKRVMLPADVVLDEEEEKAVQAAQAKIEEEKKAVDPLLENSKKLFAAMRAIYLQGFKPEELTDYWMRQDFITKVEDVGAVDTVNVALAGINLDKYQAKFAKADGAKK